MIAPFGSRSLLRGVFAALALLLATGCGGSLFNFQLFVVGEQTSLEKQVLGTYSALGENLLLYSSVRGVDEEGNLVVPPATTDSMRATYQAMRNREYNRDDIERILAAGHAGEGRDGLLVSLEGGAFVPGLTPSQIAALIAEENADRLIVLERLQETVGAANEASRDDVARIFADLNRDAAPDNTRVQDARGNWSRK